MLAYTAEAHGKEVSLTCSDGRTLATTEWEDVACFLMMPTDFAVTWQVDAFVDALTSTMPKKLAEQVKAGGRVYTPDRRKLYYQPNRVFGINYINFYGLNRYSSTTISNAKELLTLAQKVVRVYERNFGIEVTKLTSPVAVFSDILETVPFPRASDLPESAFPLLDATAKTMSREWREVYQLGHWEGNEVGDFDLHSAYPSLASNLPDISEASFFHSETMPASYTWGELYGRLRVDKEVSPFFNAERNAYTRGTWLDSITTDQLWLLRKWGIGDFDIQYGDFFLLPQIYTEPFKPTMEKLHKAKTSLDPLVVTVAKGIAVGIVGKLAERHEDSNLGGSFNSIYARMVTSRCMVKVADFIYRNQLDPYVISVLVDGVLAAKRLELPDSRAMGTWRINKPEPTLVLSLLYQWHGNLRPALLTYTDVMAKINEQPKKSVYGDIDLNLLSYGRNFSNLPKTGGDLLKKRYTSIALTAS